MVATNATHPDHPNLKAHVKAVKAGLQESEKLSNSTPVSLIEVLRPYVWRARAIPLVVSPFLEIWDILWEGLEVKDRQADDEDTCYPDEYLHIVDEVMPRQFHKVLRQIHKGDECSDDEDENKEGDYDDDEIGAAELRNTHTKHQPQPVYKPCMVTRCESQAARKSKCEFVGVIE
ncbi:hypothetical protein H1R20_g16020, partial [Candolleomyces eurysporus]